MCIYIYIYIYTKTLFTIQVRIVATDGGIPPLSAEETFRVDIQRNFAAPSFREEAYDAEISETLGIGEQIVRVSADDPDRKVSIVIAITIFNRVSIVFIGLIGLSVLFYRLHLIQ